jgi:broad specificity phosphatase PhoE
VHLVRHGQGLHNVEAALRGMEAYKMQSLMDAPLDETGRAQAAAVGARIRESAMTVDLVLVSPMTRTLQTATEMFPEAARYWAAHAGDAAEQARRATQSLLGSGPTDWPGLNNGETVGQFRPYRGEKKGAGNGDGNGAAVFGGVRGDGGGGNGGDPPSMASPPAAVRAAEPPVSPQPTSETDPPPPVRFIAVELCREAFGGHPCDQRRSVRLLAKEFPHVDFSLIATDADSWHDPNRRETVREVALRGDKFLDVIRGRPERNILVVSHGVFLETLLNRCALACIEDFLKARRFENCEMRSIIIGGWGRDTYTPDLPESNANALTEIRRKPDPPAVASAMTM